MSTLTDEIIKRPCAYVIRINRALPTSRKILDLLIDRNIKVENINLHTISDIEAVLIINCMIEHDRIRHVTGKLEKVQGIIEIELLESKASNLWK